MNTERLIDFSNRAKLLEEYLDSDAIIDITDEEFILLESLHKCVLAYCQVLKKKVQEENNIIKLKDNSHG